MADSKPSTLSPSTLIGNALGYWINDGSLEASGGISDGEEGDVGVFTQLFSQLGSPRKGVDTKGLVFRYPRLNHRAT